MLSEISIYFSRYKHRWLHIISFNKIHVKANDFGKSLYLGGLWVYICKLEVMEIKQSSNMTFEETFDFRRPGDNIINIYESMWDSRRP